MKEQANAVIIAHGNGLYSIGIGPPTAVEHNEDSVLEAFLERPAMDGTELQERSGVDNAVRVLRQLCRRRPEFAAAVTSLPQREQMLRAPVAVQRPRNLCLRPLALVVA